LTASGGAASNRASGSPPPSSATGRNVIAGNAANRIPSDRRHTPQIKRPSAEAASRQRLKTAPSDGPLTQRVSTASGTPTATIHRFTPSAKARVIDGIL